MLDKLVILGGSTPFTAALIDAFAAAEDIQPCNLVLHGRSRVRLQLMQRYSEALLVRKGWTVETQTILENALVSATFVVHQIRYGGLQLRQRCEKLCASLGSRADETLGIAALLTAIATRNSVQDTAKTIQLVSPDAWLLNLTNPLSLVTALMSEQLETRNCVGICELPQYTLTRIASILGVPHRDVQWNYQGLNHRGFIYQVKLQDEDLIARFVDQFDGTHFDGVSLETIRSLHAIPLKYFRLVEDHSYFPPDRAQTLIKLRDQLAVELGDFDGVPLPSLAKRYTEWYPLAVVPLVRALQNCEWEQHVVTHNSSAGLAIEGPVEVCRQGHRPIGQPPVSEPVAHWINRFEVHERNQLDAVRNPSKENILRALQSDPVVSTENVELLATKLRDEIEITSGGLLDDQ